MIRAVVLLSFPWLVLADPGTSPEVTFRLSEANTAVCDWHGAATFTCRAITAPVTLEMRFAPAPGRLATAVVDGTTVWEVAEPGARTLSPDELPPGAHHLELSLRDGSTVTFHRRFRFDVVRPRSETDLPAPVVLISTPRDGAEVSGTSAIEVRAYNPLSNRREVSRVDVFVDGELLESRSEPPWSFSWETRALSAGRHEVRAVAHGPAGKTSEAMARVVVLSERELVPVEWRDVTLHGKAAGANAARIDLVIPARARRVTLHVGLADTAAGGRVRATLVDGSGARAVLFQLATNTARPVPFARDLTPYRGQDVALVLEAEGDATLVLSGLSVTALE